MSGMLQMDKMNLPITVVPGSNPPQFRWRQIVSTPVGNQVIDHESNMPPTIEGALVALISIAKQLMYDNAALQGEIKGHCDRIANQSDQLSKNAEKAPPKRGK